MKSNGGNVCLCDYKINGGSTKDTFTPKNSSVTVPQSRTERRTNHLVLRRHANRPWVLRNTNDSTDTEEN